MKASKLKELTIQELEQKLIESREKLFQLRLDNNSGQLKNTSQIRQLKKDIARILTVMNEEKLKEGVAK